MFYFKSAVETKIVSILSSTQFLMTCCGCLSGWFHKLHALYGCCLFSWNSWVGRWKKLCSRFYSRRLMAENEYLVSKDSLVFEFVILTRGIPFWNVNKHNKRSSKHNCCYIKKVWLFGLHHCLCFIHQRQATNTRLSNDGL